ncbi:MAG: hypothetical protein ACLFWM_04015 [Actinomycetota bacterium]
MATLIVAYNTDALDVLGQGTAGGVILWVVAAIAAVVTLVAGAVAWLRLDDRSIVVILAAIYAVLTTVLLAMGAVPQT